VVEVIGMRGGTHVNNGKPLKGWLQRNIGKADAGLVGSCQWRPGEF
jgi:hypothetical protein